MVSQLSMACYVDEGGVRLHMLVSCLEGQSNVTPAGLSWVDEEYMNE
jgi:hypothetical protein